MSLFTGLQRIVPQKFITGLAGRLADVRWSPLKNLLINQFVRYYGVDLSEAQIGDAHGYRSFNEFFTRPLKAKARPLSLDQNTITSPADGVVSQLGLIDGGLLLQAKGIKYSVDALLGEPGDFKAYSGGQFLTIYLSPKDYHRVHMPFIGRLEKLKHLPGKLFSVNQNTAENVDGLFACNERLAAKFSVGATSFAMVMVGAMIVGGIETIATGRLRRKNCVVEPEFESVSLDKGAEFGRFYLGSTVILLFPPEMCMEFEAGLKPGSALRFGEVLGRLDVAGKVGESAE